MKRSDRIVWIAKWMAKHLTAEGGTDILNSEFVDDYLEATGAGFGFQKVGAHSCRQLGSDLSYMHSKGMLKRFRLGLPMMEPGFPKWVYHYHLDPLYRTLYSVDE